MKTILQKLKEIHPDLSHIRWDEGDVDLVFNNGSIMGRREFISTTPTHKLMLELEVKLLGKKNVPQMMKGIHNG